MEKTGRNIIIIGGLVFYVILLVLCVCQIRQSNDLITRNLQFDTIPEKTYISLQVKNYELDSMTMAKLDSMTMAKLDSAILVMKTWNENCDEKFLHGLADLRQETNNVIDKQNAWLSFWMAILALVGALFPLVFQIKVQNELTNRIDTDLQKIEPKLKEAEGKVDTKLGIVDTKLSEAERKVDTKLNEAEEIINNEIKKIKTIQAEQEKSKLYAEITKLSFTLITCKENKWTKNDYDRTLFWNDLLDHLCKNTNCFITEILKNDLYDENLLYLKMILLQLHSVYSIYIPMYTQSHKVRKLSELTREIGIILNDLSNPREDSMANLRNKLELMQIHMAAFHLL